MGLTTWTKRKLTTPRIYKYIRAYATKKKTLDLGGKFAPHKEFFPNSINVDIQPHEEVDIVADAHDLPFQNDEFEVILCTNVLGDCEDPKRVVQEMYRVLKPGGIAVLTTAFLFPIHDAPTDFWRWTEFGLRKLFKEWEEEKIIPIFNSQETVSILIQRIAFQTETNLLVRFILHLLAKIVWFVNLYPRVISRDYGDIGRTYPVDNFMPAIYFSVWKKPIEKRNKRI